MDQKQTPQWLKDYQQPVLKRKNVDCHSNHRHRTNTPAAGFVLVRLNAASKLDLLLDLRSPPVPQGSTYGFIGGNASSMGECPLTTALREAKEEYGIEPKDLNILNIRWTRDHGGYKYLNYTYVFAEYNPKDGRAPSSKTFESQRSEWFPLDALPSNLMSFIKEDRQMLEHILYNEIWPMLLERAARIPPKQAISGNVNMSSKNNSNMNSNMSSNMNSNMNSSAVNIDAEGDTIMIDSPPPAPRTPPNTHTIPKVPSPEGQFPTNSATAPGNGDVSYPKLPSIKVSPPPPSDSSRTNGDEHIPPALDNPAGAPAKMGTEVSTKATERPIAQKAAEAQPEKSANKGTFTKYALKMLSRSKEGSNAQNAAEKELKPTAKAEPAASQKKDQQEGKSLGLISRFSNLFRSSPAEANDEAAKPAEAKTNAPGSNMVQLPILIDNDWPSREPVYMMGIPPDMGNIIPGFAFRNPLET
ncbi:hypothetical protein F5B22DRAFT_301358 [Xylaria bambusicola]|uniref:uncharacterized protein n=1 Tax=Xylaria bambusicola TaxID=326684 RepID=UPI002007E95C|nr:uncharacterized protein F5B22DRAFT_301358 [Xylaria bambusicola]KAI0512674.1 hypothetical protein F5B22DRAFT_301358 [Xylaria bambusicola]